MHTDRKKNILFSSKKKKLQQHYENLMFRDPQDQDCEGKCPCKTHEKDKCDCTRHYRPVCGTDERTYANECELKCNDVVSMSSQFNKWLQSKDLSSTMFDNMKAFIKKINIML